MYAKRNYGFWMTFRWSMKPFLYSFIYASIICLIAMFLPENISLAFPWQPIGVIAVAVAFYLGFKNNSSYDRTWEARKIWGSLVNNSRSFGAAIIAFAEGKEAHKIHKEMIYRHVAWLTALRHQLRLSRAWEHQGDRIPGLFYPTPCENYQDKLEKELLAYLATDEIEDYRDSTNMATQIMAKQAQRLQELYKQGYFNDFRHMQLHELMVSFYEDQGKSERIKNFPFPRQYASAALWLSTVFALVLPFGMLDILKDVNGWMEILCPFTCALLTWVYFLMEKIGDYSENPFEGSFNDVPITSIARGIEIDLREMITDSNIPAGIPEQNGFLL